MYAIEIGCPRLVDGTSMGHSIMLQVNRSYGRNLDLRLQKFAKLKGRTRRRNQGNPYHQIPRMGVRER